MVSHGKHQLASMGELADGESHAIPCLPPAARALHFTGVMTEGSFRPPREQAWLLSLSGHAAEDIPGLIQNKTDKWLVLAGNFTRQVFVFMKHQQFFKATY